jgi:hypothetical protein
MMVAFKLSKAGYGKPSEILKEPLDIVLGMIEYERFIPEYEERFTELNQKER